MSKDNSRDIAERIIALVKSNLLSGKETSVEDVSKLIRNEDILLNKSFTHPNDRKDSPHHHTNRLD